VGGPAKTLRTTRADRQRALAVEEIHRRTAGTGGGKP
jgi:hypothetical protein